MTLLFRSRAHLAAQASAQQRIRPRFSYTDRFISKIPWPELPLDNIRRWKELSSLRRSFHYEQVAWQESSYPGIHMVARPANNLSEYRILIFIVLQNPSPSNLPTSPSALHFRGECQKQMLNSRILQNWILRTSESTSFKENHFSTSHTWGLGLQVRLIGAARRHVPVEIGSTCVNTVSWACAIQSLPSQMT